MIKCGTCKRHFKDLQRIKCPHCGSSDLTRYKTKKEVENMEFNRPFLGLLKNFKVERESL